MIQEKAVLEFDDGQSLPLTTGDPLTIPAHLRHRVASVSQDTVWLALHYST